MRMRSVLVAAALLISRFAFAGQPSVTALDGKIYFNDANGGVRQLTASGQDSAPVLSPDARYVVFVRAIAGEKIFAGSGDNEPAELWQIRSDGKEPTRLLRTRASDKPEKLIAAFDNLQFSPDGTLVYFVTPAWATSGAVHVVDSRNSNENYVLPGNSVEVIPSGKYRGHLLVSQHRYFIGAGSYDWFWLFSPTGKEVGPVGEDVENFKSIYVTN